MSLMPRGKRQRTPMSKEHKAALARGREEGRAVRNYLEALDEHRPRRGRKRTPESIARRLETIDDEIAEADPLTRLHLLQERTNLEADLERSESADDMAELEEAFVEVAASYGERKGIGYAAWREAGVPAQVLQRAEIGRSRR